MNNNIIEHLKNQDTTTVETVKTVKTVKTVNSIREAENVLWDELNKSDTHCTKDMWFMINYFSEIIKKYEQQDSAEGLLEIGKLFELFFHQTKNKQALITSIKYLIMSSDRGNSDASFNLAEYYYHKLCGMKDVHEQNDLSLCVKYLLRSKIFQQIPVFDRLICEFSKLRIYYEITNSTNQSSLMGELLTDRNVINYERKKSLMSIIGTCSNPNCKTSMIKQLILVIPKECADYYCYDCYVKINNCCICFDISNNDDKHNIPEDCDVCSNNNSLTRYGLLFGQLERDPIVTHGAEKYLYGLHNK